MKEKVLLVDDEKAFVDTLAERLRNRGMAVSTTGSPVEALARTEEEEFDAVILDLAMPEMDGIETLSRMKKKNPDLQVILLTGQASVEKGIAAMKLGAMDFLEKPIDLSKLSERIKKAHVRKMVILEKRMEKKIKGIMGAKGW